MRTVSCFIRLSPDTAEKMQNAELRVTLFREYPFKDRVILNFVPPRKKYFIFWRRAFYYKYRILAHKIMLIYHLFVTFNETHTYHNI